MLEEESAGGFAVTVPLIRRVSVDEEGVLKSDRGQFRVRVAHVTPQGAEVRIGLERIADIEETPTRNTSRNGVRGGKFKNPMASGILVPAVILLVVGLGGAEFYFRSSGKKKVETTDVKYDRSEAVKRFQALRKLTGPATTKQMRLTRSQQQAVIRVTHRALSELQVLQNSRGNVSDDELADLSMQVIYNATDMVHHLLDARQKAVWTNIMSQRGEQVPSHH